MILKKKQRIPLSPDAKRLFRRVLIAVLIGALVLGAYVFTTETRLRDYAQELQGVRSCEQTNQARADQRRAARTDNEAEKRKTRVLASIFGYEEPYPPNVARAIERLDAEDDIVLYDRLKALAPIDCEE